MKIWQIPSLIIILVWMITFVVVSSYHELNLNWVDEFEKSCGRVPSSKFSYGCETQKENTVKCEWEGVGFLVGKEYMECPISGSLMNEGYPVDDYGFIRGVATGVQYCTANSAEQAFKNCVSNLPIGLQNNRKYMVII